MLLQTLGRVTFVQRARDSQSTEGVLFPHSYSTDPGGAVMQEHRRRVGYNTLT